MIRQFVGIAFFALVLGGCASTNAYSAPEATLEFRSQKETRSVSYQEWSAPSELSFEFAPDEGPSKAEDDEAGAPAQSMGAPTRASRGHNLAAATQPAQPN